VEKPALHINKRLPGFLPTSGIVLKAEFTVSSPGFHGSSEQRRREDFWPLYLNTTGVYWLAALFIS
jgi:hypothetical protein